MSSPWLQSSARGLRWSVWGLCGGAEETLYHCFFGCLIRGQWHCMIILMLHGSLGVLLLCRTYWTTLFRMKASKILPSVLICCGSFGSPDAAHYSRVLRSPSLHSSPLSLRSTQQTYKLTKLMVLQLARQAGMSSGSNQCMARSNAMLMPRCWSRKQLWALSFVTMPVLSGTRI